MAVNPSHPLDDGPILARTSGECAIVCPEEGRGGRPMSYLVGGGQIVAGLVALVLLWLVLTFLGRRTAGKVLGATGLVFWPSVVLLWFVGGCVLVLRGMGAV
jgi:hypothetical protein